jgi:hypothetical protein
MASEAIGSDGAERDDLEIMLTSAVGAGIDGGCRYLRAIILDSDLEVVVGVFLLL